MIQFVWHRMTCPQRMGAILLSSLMSLSPMLVSAQMQQPESAKPMKPESKVTTSQKVESRSSTGPATPSGQPVKTGKSMVREKEEAEHETPAQEKAEHGMKPVTTTHKTTVHQKITKPSGEYTVKKGKSEIRQIPVTTTKTRTEKHVIQSKTGEGASSRTITEPKKSEPVKKGQSEVRQAPQTMTEKNMVNTKTEKQESEKKMIEPMKTEPKKSEPVKKGQSEVRQTPEKSVKKTEPAPAKESPVQKVEQGVKDTGKHIEQGWNKMMHH